MAQTEFHVVPRSGRWEIVRDGEVLEVFHTKRPALEAAMDRAAACQPAKVIVHGDTRVVERRRGGGNNTRGAPAA